MRRRKENIFIMVTFSCETELSAHLNLFEYLKNEIQFQNDFFNEIGYDRFGLV